EMTQTTALKHKHTKKARTGHTPTRMSADVEASRVSADVRVASTCQNPTYTTARSSHTNRRVTSAAEGTTPRRKIPMPDTNSTREASMIATTLSPATNFPRITSSRDRKSVV